MAKALTVSIAAKNFGSKILWSSAEGIRLLIILHVEFAKTEVAQRNMTGVVKKDIFGFQIPEGLSTSQRFAMEVLTDRQHRAHGDALKQGGVPRCRTGHVVHQIGVPFADDGTALRRLQTCSLISGGERNQG